MRMKIEKRKKKFFFFCCENQMTIGWKQFIRSKYSTYNRRPKNIYMDRYCIAFSHSSSLSLFLIIKRPIHFLCWLIFQCMRIWKSFYIFRFVLYYYQRPPQKLYDEQSEKKNCEMKNCIKWIRTHTHERYAFRPIYALM